MVVSTRIRREGGALHVFSVQNFVRVGRSAGVVHALRGDFAAISALRAAKGVVFGSGPRRAGEGTRPYGGCRDVSVLLVGAGPRPARGRGKPLPYGDQKTFRVCVGEPLGAPPRYAPGALAVKTQAQAWNRTKGKFCILRPPVGPDGTAPRHS